MARRALLLAAALCTSHAAIARAEQPPSATPEPTQAAPSPTIAEQANTGPSDSGEIVVTAQKRSERLLEVPMSVAAISGTQLQKAGIVSTLNIAQTTPGVNTVNTGFGFIPVIRGIQSSGTSPGDESNVAIYVDDISLGSPVAGFFDLADIERIETLKGPQGTLFGRNATGGAIRIVTRKPSFTTSGDVSADYGFRYQELRTSGYLTGPLADHLAGSVSATYRKGWDGFIKGTGPNEGRTYGKPDNYVFRGKLLFEPSDQFSITAIADTSRQQNDSVFISMVPAGTNPVPGSIASTPFTYPDSTQPKANLKASGGSLDWTWRPSDDITLRSITGYRETSVQSQSDTDRTSRTVSSNQISQYQHNLSQELNLSSNSTDKVAWLLGAYYYDSIAGNPYFRQYIGDAPGGTISTNFTNRVTSEAVAGFGELTLNLGKFHLTGGGRYNTETKHFFYRDLARPSGLPLQTTLSQHTWNSFTYRAVARYDLSHDANVYASISNGFKSGVYNAYSSLGNPVNPEKVQAYEIGAKARVAGLTLTAAAYAYDYKDIQVSAYVTVNGQLLISLSNAATAKMRGFEFTADGRLDDHISFNAGVGWEPTAKYSKYTGSQVVAPIANAVPPAYAQVIVPYDSSGSQMVRTPKVTANLRINYETSIFGGNLYATISNSYSSEFFWQPGNFSREDPYVVGNARISWSTANGRMTYSVWANNLYETRNHTDVTPNTLAGDSIKFLPKRQIGIGAAFKF